MGFWLLESGERHLLRVEMLVILNTANNTPASSWSPVSFPFSQPNSITPMELQQECSLQPDMHTAERNPHFWPYSYASYSRTWGMLLRHSRLLSLCHQAYSHGRHTSPERDIEPANTMRLVVRISRTSIWLADLQCSLQMAIQIRSCPSRRCGEGDFRESSSMRLVPHMWFIQSTQVQ